MKRQRPLPLRRKHIRAALVSHPELMLSILQGTCEHADLVARTLLAAAGMSPDSYWSALEERHPGGRAHV